MKTVDEILARFRAEKLKPVKVTLMYRLNLVYSLGFRVMGRLAVMALAQAGNGVGNGAKFGLQCWDEST